jgi:Uncharacterized protein conserved in bacteria (DUF2169)
MSRKLARDRYDAVLDFAPARSIPELAYLIVKQTFKIGRGSCVLTTPEPLAHDIRDDKLEPRFPPGSDFWTQKEATDVVVRGSAFAPGGRPTRSMTISVSVGDFTKSICVFGERILEWRSDGRPRIPEAEPFTEMPLTYANAYGGIDPRPKMEAPKSPEEFLEFDLFHYPGLYPRNHFGKGYLVEHGPLPGFPLPNLENPADLLTEQRLVVGDPRLWYRQPTPWCYDWTNPVMFPRQAYLGLSPHFPPPADQSLPEIAAGILPADYAEQFGADRDDPSPPAEFYQEASQGMHFKALAAGTPIRIDGMDPVFERIEFRLPASPPIQLFLEGNELPTTTSLSNCVITPAESRLELVYVCVATELPRVFIPGVHKHIPFRAVIDGDSPLDYETPIPNLERLEQRA